MNIILSTAVLASLFSASPSYVHGHAYMSEPASRNSFASTSGTWGSEAGVPPVETTPQGINSNTNVCGREGAQKDVRKN